MCIMVIQLKSTIFGMNPYLLALEVTNCWASAVIVVVKSEALENIGLRGNWLVASSKANLKESNDGVTATTDMFYQLVN